MRAIPTGSREPAIMRAHSFLSCIPAKVWMALSMHLWQGTKHPSIPLLAALTIASHFRVVISPFHRHMPPSKSRSSIRVIPLDAETWERSLSCIARMSSGIGEGGLTFIRDLRRERLFSEDSGISGRMPSPSER